MQIKYQEAKRVIEEMLTYVSNMEKELSILKKSTDAFASQIDDSISEKALHLVDELSNQIKLLRVSIESCLETSSEGMTMLKKVEKTRSGDISRI